jgi:hypothetical protein
MAQDADPKVVKNMEEKMKQLEKVAAKTKALDKEVADHCKALAALSKQRRG